MRLSAPSRVWPVLLCFAGLIALLALAPVAQASSGRVVPPGFRQPPGEPLRALPLSAATPSYGLWDAQSGGALIAVWGSSLTLNSTDATGKTIWSVTGKDIWTASGTLPAALVAVYSTSNPNVPRSGHLVAYRADGSVRFKRSFTNAYVVPLCDTTSRLEWVEVSASHLIRLFVHQSGETRTLRVPTFATKKWYPLAPPSCSRNGDAIALGSIIAPGNNGNFYHRVYWIRVNAHGVPRVVSDKRTDWDEVVMSPSGKWAAAVPLQGYPKTWVRFGQFSGPHLPSDDTFSVQVGPHLIFESDTGGYGSSDGTTWDLNLVETVQLPHLYLSYERAWTDGSVRFAADANIQWALSSTAVPGSLTVINLESWDTASVPNTYADAMVVPGGKIATLTDTGALAYIANPVPNP
jgi:hypothetical protein